MDNHGPHHDHEQPSTTTTTSIEIAPTNPEEILRPIIVDKIHPNSNNHHLLSLQIPVTTGRGPIQSINVGERSSEAGVTPEVLSQGHVVDHENNDEVPEDPEHVGQDNPEMPPSPGSPGSPGSPYSLRFPGSEETRRRLYVDLGRPRPFYRRPSEGQAFSLEEGDDMFVWENGLEPGKSRPSFGEPKSLQVSILYQFYLSTLCTHFKRQKDQTFLIGLQL